MNDYNYFIFFNSYGILPDYEKNKYKKMFNQTYQ